MQMNFQKILLGLLIAAGIAVGVYFAARDSTENPTTNPTPTQNLAGFTPQRVNLIEGTSKQETNRAQRYRRENSDPYKDAGTDYTTASVEENNVDEANGLLDLTNFLICVVRQTNPDTRPNAQWKALVNEGTCDKKTKNGALAEVTLSSKRDSFTDPQIINIWFKSYDGTKYIAILTLNPTYETEVQELNMEMKYFQVQKDEMKEFSPEETMHGFIDVKINGNQNRTIKAAHVEYENGNGQAERTSIWADGEINNRNFISKVEKNLFYIGKTNSQTYKRVKHTGTKQEEKCFFLPYIFQNVEKMEFFDYETGKAFAKTSMYDFTTKVGGNFGRLTLDWAGSENGDAGFQSYEIGDSKEITLEKTEQAAKFYVIPSLFKGQTKQLPEDEDKNLFSTGSKNPIPDCPDCTDENCKFTLKGVKADNKEEERGRLFIVKQGEANKEVTEMCFIKDDQDNNYHYEPKTQSIYVILDEGSKRLQLTKPAEFSYEYNKSDNRNTKDFQIMYSGDKYEIKTEYDSKFDDTMTIQDSHPYFQHGVDKKTKWLYLNPRYLFYLNLKDGTKLKYGQKTYVSKALFVDLYFSKATDEMQCPDVSDLDVMKEKLPTDELTTKDFGSLTWSGKPEVMKISVHSGEEQK